MENIHDVEREKFYGNLGIPKIKLTDII